jgi:hypothetical protein
MFSNINKKIGITIKIGNIVDAFFTNGMNQNALFFYDLLSNIGYDVSFIVSPTSFANSTQNAYFVKYPKYKFIVDDNIDEISAFKIIIMVSYILHRPTMISLKSIGAKLVYYCCGNEYISDTSSIVYSANDDITGVYLNDDNTPLYNAVWLLPHHMNMNYYYSQTLQRCKVAQIPYVWSPSLLMELSILKNINFDYVYRGDSNKRISIFEPNLSFMKWSLPPIMVCENAYRMVEPSAIKHIYTCNIDANQQFKLKSFNTLVKTFDLFRDNKISIERRYISLEMMAKHADIVVSHQTENNMNNLWFDLAWYGWPIIHNGNLCKDIGYYYDGYNYEMGGHVLVDVLKNHDKNAVEYMNRNRQLLDRYSPTNVELQCKYKLLIDELDL